MANDGRVLARSIRITVTPTAPESRSNRKADGPKEVTRGACRSVALYPQRFFNSSSPVRTHHVSFVLNHLGRAHLRRITLFADYCAPTVHQENRPERILCGSFARDCSKRNGRHGLYYNAFAASFSIWTQGKNHSMEILRLQTSHADEITRLQQIHSDELARLEAGDAWDISVLPTTTGALVKSAYRSGGASARRHVFKEEEQTGSWFWKTKRGLAIAVVLDENGIVLAFAGDGTKIRGYGPRIDKRHPNGTDFVNPADVEFHKGQLLRADAPADSRLLNKQKR